MKLHCWWRWHWRWRWWRHCSAVGSSVSIIWWLSCVPALATVSHSWWWWSGSGSSGLGSWSWSSPGRGDGWLIRWCWGGRVNSLFNPTPPLSFSTWTPFLLILFLPTFTFSLRSFPPPLLFLPILFSSSFSPHVFTPLPQSPPGHDTPAGQPPPSQWWWLLSIVLVSGFN